MHKLNYINEIWLPIIGYEGYEVSNYGNVRSIDRNIINNNRIHKLKSKPLKPEKNRYGYYQVTLCVDGNRKSMTIHKLVAEAFISNPENKPEVNHKDGIKTNCNVFNLEWNTHSENNQHAYNTGLNKGAWIGKFGVKHPKSKPVIQLDKVGNIQNRFVSAREAYVKTGVSHKNISNCCLGRIMSAGGYVWKFDI